MSKIKLPQGWVECELKDIFDIVTGKTPSKKHPEYFGGDIPFVKPGDLDKEKFIYYTEEDSLTDEGFKNAPFLPKYSVLVSCIGNLGKKAILGVDGSCNQQINVILPNEYVDYKYLYYYIDKIIPWMEQNASATTVTILNKGKFEQAPFLLPPLNEQKRIVAKIEEEFGKIDEGVEKLKLAQEQIKQYRQSVLKSAFDGKLYKTTEWEETTLEKITSYIQRGKSPKYSETENKNYIINQKCIRWNELQCEFKKFVTDDFWNQLTKERFLQPGDILWNSTGTGTIGRAYLFKGNEITKAVVDSHVTIVRVENKHVMSEFLFYFIMSPFIQYKIESMQNGSTNQVELGRNEIKNTIIKLPTIDEQKQIVKEIKKRFEVAEEAERVITENLEKAEQLKQSILKKAFEGRLVTQNPTDEPASILLEKIKTERNK